MGSFFSNSNVRNWFPLFTSIMAIFDFDALLLFVQTLHVLDKFVTFCLLLQYNWRNVRMNKQVYISLLMSFVKASFDQTKVRFYEAHNTSNGHIENKWHSPSSCTQLCALARCCFKQQCAVRIRGVCGTKLLWFFLFQLRASILWWHSEEDISSNSLFLLFELKVLSRRNFILQVSILYKEKKLKDVEMKFIFIDKLQKLDYGK